MKRIAALTLVLAAITVVGIGTQSAVGGGLGSYWVPQNWQHAGSKHYRHPGHYRDGWAWRYRPWIWVAVSKNIRGVHYVGRGPAASIATTRALNRCRSNSAFPWGCYVSKVKRVKRR